MAIDTDKNETVGAVIFDNWTENSVCAHMIITKPMLLRHGFLEECFDFAFNVCGRKVITGLVNSDNVKAQKLDEHIGFTEIGRFQLYRQIGINRKVEIMSQWSGYLFG